MLKTLFYSSLVIIILTCTHCKQLPVHERKLLNKAESLLYKNVDSAIILLNSIPHPSQLPQKDFYRFFLLKAEAKHKKDRDISSDTLVFLIEDFFAHKKDFHNVAKAAYLAGTIYTLHEKLEKATQKFLEADNYSKLDTDYNLKGLINGALGNVYYGQLLKDEAIVRYKKAVRYFHEANNHKNLSIALNMIGNCFLLKNMPDSAIAFYHKGLTIADKYNLTSEKISIQQCLGVTYRETERWDKAKNIFSSTLSQTGDSTEKARTYYNLANVFAGTKQYDSALVCLNTAINLLNSKENIFLLANIYKSLSLVNEQKGDFNSALNNHKLYSEYLAAILEKNKNSAILEIREKYNIQTLLAKNRLLIIQRQRNIIIISGLLLILGIFLFVYYLQDMNRKKELLEIEKRIYQLKEMAQTAQKEKNSFRSVLLEQFGILKKAALLEIYLRNDNGQSGRHFIKTFNKVVYGQEELDWNKFYRTMDSAYNGLFTQMKQELRELNETEFRICCLAYAGLSNTETAVILGYSPNTIQAKKSLIRKKLKVGKFANFKSFLDEKIKENRQNKN